MAKGCLVGRSFVRGTAVGREPFREVDPGECDSFALFLGRAFGVLGV